MIRKINSRRSPLLIIRRASIFFILTFVSCFVPSLRAQERVVTLDPAQTNVHFTLGTTLHTVHGIFELKSGQIRFDPSSGKASGAIIVDAASGNSKDDGRDKKMHHLVLESQKFPEIVFTPTEVKGTLAPQGTSLMDVSGTFRLHGEDHGLTLSITVEPAGASQLVATTKFSVPFIKWGLKNPSNFFLKVDDRVEIEIHATGQLTSESAQH